MTVRKQRTTWSLDKHRILRKFVILISLIPLWGLFQMENIFYYEFSGTYMEDKIHGSLFSEFLDKVLEYGGRATFAILLIGVVLLLLAHVGQFFENEMEHRFHTMGLVTCSFAGIFYSFIVIVIGDSNMNWQGMEWLFLVAVLLGILLSIHSFISFKNTQDEFVQVKRTTKIVSYLAVGILIVSTLVYFGIGIGKDYAEVLEVKKLIKNQRQEKAQDIEYQMGNYSTGAAVFVDEYLYLIDGDNAICRIDQQGHREIIHKEPRTREIQAKGLYYHDGYLYYCIKVEMEELYEAFHLYDQHDGAKVYEEIVRTSVETGVTQDILYCDKPLYFGIVNDDLYYMELTNLDHFEKVKHNLGVDEAEKVYVLDLNTLYAENEVKLYDKGVYLQYSHTYWLTRYLYNNQYDYWKSCEDYAYISPAEQPYSDGVFYLQDDGIVNDTLYKIIRNDVKDKPNHLEWRWNTIDKNVCAYNLFNDVVYYMKENSDGTFELWYCDMDGANKTLVCSITPDDRYDYDSPNEHCTRIYLSPNYVVCDFTAYSVGYTVDERYVVRISDGKIMQ
ncbi:MAG: hypothetical protein IJX85_05025 [Lachnospiraceae bacterium]|nr:hypothetical protein [Lachnospiraceae bacterium]